MKLLLKYLTFSWAFSWGLRLKTNNCCSSVTKNQDRPYLGNLGNKKSYCRSAGGIITDQSHQMLWYFQKCDFFTFGSFVDILETETAIRDLLVATWPEFLGFFFYIFGFRPEIDGFLPKHCQRHNGPRVLTL